MKIGIYLAAADLTAITITLEKLLSRDVLDYEHPALERLTPSLRGLALTPFRTERRAALRNESIAACTAAPRDEDARLRGPTPRLPDKNLQTPPPNIAAFIAARLTITP
jgi:hypothetical protein